MKWVGKRGWFVEVLKRRIGDGRATKNSTETKQSSKEKKNSVLNRRITFGFGGSKSKGGKEVDKGSAKKNDK